MMHNLQKVIKHRQVSPGSTRLIGVTSITMTRLQINLLYYTSGCDNRIQLDRGLCTQNMIPLSYPNQGEDKPVHTITPPLVNYVSPILTYVLQSLRITWIQIVTRKGY